MIHKVEDRRQLANKIQERLDKSPEVRPFPAVVARLVSACQDPNATSREFESIIECDPALSGKILRMANSPMYCPSGSVKSISHAVSLLGLRKLRSVAMSIAAESMFADGGEAVQARKRLWSHSVGCAMVARYLAEHVPDADPDVAFLGGLFHDIGKLLFYDAIPNEYDEIDGRLCDMALIEEEQFLFSTTHVAVGSASAASWGLPVALWAATRWHHNPEEADCDEQLVNVVAAANCLSREWGIGDCGNAGLPAPDHILKRIDLEEEQFAAIREQAEGSFEGTMAATR